MNLIAIKRLLKEISKRKPILGGLHYDVNDGLLEVCDTFSLVQESVKLTITHDLIIDINTGKELAGTYPETKGIKTNASQHERITIKKDGEKTLTIKMKNDKKCYEYDGFYWDAKIIDNAFACLDKKPLEILTKEENTLFIVGKGFNPYLIYENENAGQYILSIGLSNKKGGF